MAGTHRPLIGREPELRALEATIAALEAGRGGVLTVAGEPGIGKTRLLDALGELAREAGIATAWGRCWESGGAPSYWPWTQVLRALDEPGPEELGAETRFELFDAVATRLRAGAERRPLLIVLDDLHAADPASLLLTEFVAEQLLGAPVLLAFAFREQEATRRSDAAVFTELLRLADRVALEGLGTEDLAALVQSRRGDAPDPRFVAELHASTGGNPFFADEVLRAGGGRVPRTVRDTIIARADALSAETRATLEAAAVIGSEFRIDTLRRVVGGDAEALTDQLEEAASIGLTTRDPREPTRYRLDHALVREALYEAIPPPRRARLHGAVGEAVLAAYPDDLDRRASELAHHFCLAAPPGDPQRALEFALRAGWRALEALAYEQAADHFEEALGVLDQIAGGEARRAELLLARGGALMRAGRLELARDTFRAAAGEARDARELARAALGVGVWGMGAGDVDPDVITLCEQALERLGDREAPLRARLLARLASALHWGPEEERRAAVAAEALALAAEAEPDTRAYVLLHTVIATWGPATRDEREARALEARALAEQAADLELVVQAQLALIPALLERGDGAGARREIALLERTLEAIHQPRVGWQASAYRAMLAGVEGRWEDYEAAAGALADEARSVPGSVAMVVYVAQRLVTLANQGRAGELEPVFAANVDAHPGVPVWRCALAVAQFDAGHTARAGASVALLAGDGFASVPRDHAWLTALALAADVARRGGDRAAAERLYELLLPWAERHVVTASALYYGPVARFLGGLALVLERPRDALAHLALARAGALRMNALPNLVHIALAEAAAHTALGDPAAAAAAAAQAAALAHEIGRPELAPAVAAAPAREPDTAATAELRREGDVWTFAYDGRATRLPDAKGLQHLALLLASPGVEIHAAELASGDGPARTGAEGLTVRSVGDDDAGPLLDTQAKAAYRARIEDLRAEIEEAESFNDPERVARAREELEFLGRELAGAVGLGGRDRKAASTAERARVNVTRAIRSVLKRVAEHDAALGAELEATVRTGTFCAYQPDPRRPLRWHVTRD